MKPRSCRIVANIANDRGAEQCYALRPLAAPDLGASAAAFTLVKLTGPDAPVYTVRLALDGQTSCDCPRHTHANNCKHADALTAAGVLPSALLSALQHRSNLLDMTEKMLKDTEAELKQLRRNFNDLIESAKNLNEWNAQLSAALDKAQAPAGPKRSRRPARAKAA